MTIIANVVERFTMQIEEPAPGHEEWFLDWVLRSPKEAGRHLTAGWMAMNSLKEIYKGADDIQTCREYFGGMGAQALMAERLFNLRSHWVHDYSMDAVEHLEKLGLKASQEDAYDASRFPPGCDNLVLLDFGDLTVWKTREGEKHRELLDRVFQGAPKAVLLTDIACRYLHLHRDRYEGLLGPETCQSYPSYLEALLTRLEALYGYRLHRGYWDRWSAVMSLVPDDLVASNTLIPTPESPVGLELL